MIHMLTRLAGRRRKEDRYEVDDYVDLTSSTNIGRDLVHGIHGRTGKGSHVAR